MRSWKQLQGFITLSVTHRLMGKDGWTFKPGPGVVPDALHGATCLHQLCSRADPHYTGEVPVPMLWDKQQDTIVSTRRALAASEMMAWSAATYVAQLFSIGRASYAAPPRAVNE